VAQHPEHAAIAAEVRSWYTDWAGDATGRGASVADIGVQTRREPFGYLRSGPGAARRLVLTVEGTTEVSEALAAAARFFGSDAFEVWIDRRELAAAAEPALVTAGFASVATTTIIALAEPLRAIDGPRSLRVREVSDDATLQTWARVKLQAFADSESEPIEERLHAELAARRAEWPISRYDLATVGDEPVAVLAHYTASRDQMVFLLATRILFRHRGIAQSLLQRWARRAAAEGARSLLINCEEGGRPAALYRRMGFTDEVYWHRRYAPTALRDHHDPA
jgi:GNAT superfamily N-acetyltransferase